jgi:hypothetical protein
VESEETVSARHRFDEHVSAATDTHAEIKELLVAVLYILKLVRASNNLTVSQSVELVAVMS